MDYKPKGKVGIMTFHWAANYGAVLQAWALQEYLCCIGYDAEIIDYVPSNHAISFHRCFRTKHIQTVKNRYKEYKKEKMIKDFRAQYMNLSALKYSSKNDLKKAPPIYDIYISGSDQIWNPSFTMNGQNGVTLCYYLDFAPDGKKRIAFSSSFGCKSITEGVQKVIKPELEKYKAIGTRELEGVEILKSIGIEAYNTADPTILLEASNYEKLLKNGNGPKNGIYVYMLHGQKALANDVINHVQIEKQLPVYSDDELTVESWLTYIHDARFVITNSFHCVVFCLQFHIPFLAIDVSGMDMSSRITTLLGNVGLEDRFIRLPVSAESLKMSRLSDIQWDDVDIKLEALRKNARGFLNRALESRSRVDDIPDSICTACGLCSVVCPVACISMEEDQSGFIHPVIDNNRCTHCSACAKKCIALVGKKSSAYPVKSYSCWNVDEAVRGQSSSGGIFTAIAETAIEKGGVVFGAEYTAPLTVEHCSADSVDALDGFRGSKYQPSHAWKAYVEVKTLLKKGKHVLFSGTPCQIAAIQNLTGNPDNLVCIDIACHGVPSLKILREKCASLGGDVAWIDFRNKRTGWKDYTCVFHANNGQEIAHEIASESDFMRGYIANYYIRESCENCTFATMPRSGDISLADCWIKVHDGTDKEDKGITAVLINSEKGEKLFNSARQKMTLEAISLHHLLKGTPTLTHGSTPSDRRSLFWHDYMQYGYEKTMKKYFATEILKSKILRKVRTNIRG